MNVHIEISNKLLDMLPNNNEYITHLPAINNTVHLNKVIVKPSRANRFKNIYKISNSVLQRREDPR